MLFLRKALEINLPLVFQQRNPKAERTQSRMRYEGYKKAKTLRLYVPGGEAEHAKWLAAIQRCCDGVLGTPAPPDVTEKEVAKPKKSFVFGGHSFF